jgi:hypothetical protein
MLNTLLMNASIPYFVTLIKPNYTDLKMLTASEKMLQRAGITLWLVDLKPEPFQRIRQSPLGQTLGDKRMFPNLQRAGNAFMDQNGHRSMQIMPGINVNKEDGS